MSKAKILVIDDDPDILNLVRYNLEREGFSVLTAANGQDALQLVHAQPPQAIILDLMLPEVDGLEISRQIKRDPTLSDIPIIMLTAKGEGVDRVVGFELGADDYITKPFSPRELVLRLKAILKRSTPREEPIRRLSLKDLEIDFDRHQVWIGGEEISLTVIEFGLLSTLASRRGRVQARSPSWPTCGIMTPTSTPARWIPISGGCDPGAMGRGHRDGKGLGYRFREEGP